MHLPVIRHRGNISSTTLASKTNKENNAKSRRQRKQAQTLEKTPQTQPIRWNIGRSLTALSKLSTYHSFCTLVHCVSAGVAAYQALQKKADQHIKKTVPAEIQSALLGLYALTATAEAGIAILTAYIAVQTFYDENNPA
jgi:hypothetical protein